jgi:hypothetical protein
MPTCINAVENRRRLRFIQLLGSGDVIYKKFCREVAVLFWKTGETENVDRINAMSMLLADISEKETTESLLTNRWGGSVIGIRAPGQQYRLRHNMEKSGE